MLDQTEDRSHTEMELSHLQNKANDDMGSMGGGSAPAPHFKVNRRGRSGNGQKYKGTLEEEMDEIAKIQGID